MVGLATVGLSPRAGGAGAARGEPMGMCVRLASAVRCGGVIDVRWLWGARRGVG